MNRPDTATVLPRPDEPTGIARRDGNGVAVSANAPVTQLLQLAVERGTPVEQMEKLVDLYERMEAREAAREFNRALAAFQAACPPIGKNKTANIATRGGGTYSYSYASLDEIVAIVRPILQQHGLSFGWDSAVEAGHLTCVCTLRHENGHSVSAKFTLPTASQSAMSEQQKVGAALTFAQRKSLESVLGIVATDKEVPDDEVDPSTITDDQATAIDDLITETKSHRARFLKLFDAETVADIRAADYRRAIALLSEKKARARP